VKGQWEKLLGKEEAEKRILEWSGGRRRNKGNVKRQRFLKGPRLPKAKATKRNETEKKQLQCHLGKGRGA